LRATVGWSYSLLASPERVPLGRLSVFAGGFGLNAAEAVSAPVAWTWRMWRNRDKTAPPS
jgi:predicted ATPase